MKIWERNSLSRGVKVQKPCSGNMCVLETARRPVGLELGEKCSRIREYTWMELTVFTGTWCGACEAGPVFMTEHLCGAFFLSQGLLEVGPRAGAHMEMLS